MGHYFVGVTSPFWLTQMPIYYIYQNIFTFRSKLEANLVDDLSKYKWSSYPSYTGDWSQPTWLIRSEIYAQLTTKFIESLLTF